MTTIIKGFLSNIQLASIVLGITLIILGCKDNSPKQNEVESSTEIESKTQELADKTEKKVILCFGNSLTAGYGLDDERTWWTSLLQDRIDSLNLDYKVVNAGLSGETTSEGVQRISWVLNQPVDIFILELGANDMLRGLAVENTKSNLEEIIKKVKAKNENIKIVIAGMLAPPNMGQDYEKEYNKIFSSLASKYDASLIPFFLENVALDPELNLPDGKHPNVDGQKVVLENVWKALEGNL
jgi:acyl-CoA thioesterase-1